VASQLEPQLAALRDGLGEVMPISSLRCFAPEELAERFCGRTDVQFGDRARMRRVLLSFDYAGERRDKYDPEERAACVLLAMLEDFNGKERRDFLVFSSSVARLVKPIVVSRRLGRVNAQERVSPFGHTCSFHIEVPDYYELSGSPKLLHWDGSPATMDAYQDMREAAADAYPHVPFALTEPPPPGSSQLQMWYEVEVQHPDLHVELQGFDASCEELLLIYSAGLPAAKARRARLAREKELREAGEMSERELLKELEGITEDSFLPGEATADMEELPQSSSEPQDVSRTASVPEEDTPQFRFAKSLARFAFLTAFKDAQSNGFRERQR